MKGPIPKCLLSWQRGMWITATNSEGRDILFAFSTLGKGKLFGDRIAQQGEAGGLVPYNATVEDLLPFLLTTRKERLVAIDANGLTDRSYHVVGLSAVINAIKEGSEEIEYVEYVPRELKTENA